MDCVIEGCPLPATMQYTPLAKVAVPLCPNHRGAACTVGDAGLTDDEKTQLLEAAADAIAKLPELEEPQESSAAALSPQQRKQQDKRDEAAEAEAEA